MEKINLIIKQGLRFIFISILIIVITGCSINNLFATNQKLPAVTPVNTPQIPNWIAEISPTENAATKSQIRIIFKEALIPIESLDTPAQQAKLKQFEITPAIPGEFRFLTPKMVGFQPEKALPKATRIKVTVKSGLTDLQNHRLEEDLAWTFTTEAIKLTQLPNSKKNPDSEPKYIDIKPTLKFTSNVELDLASLQQYTKLTPEGKNTNIPIKFDLEKAETKQPEKKFDPSLGKWKYTIIPQQDLEKATRYNLEFSPGLLPAYGNLPTEKAFITQVETYSPLAFQGIKFINQPDSGGAYGRFVKGSAELEFNNGIIADSAKENISINPTPKETSQLVKAYDKEKNININPWALEPNTNYTIAIDANLKDEFGQTLGKPVTVKYQTGDVAGEIWTPSGLNIFPAGKDLQLNISTVNLPESSYKAAFKVLQPTDLIYNDSAYPQGEGKDLLPKPNTWQKFRVSGRKNQTQETTINLRKQLGNNTGMLAYSVQAKTNKYEENNQQKWRENEIYGLVQLTNLGVFAQWFPDSGLIRVNHLSDGGAVDGANIEIYESKLEEKSPKETTPCATGKTDKNGILFLPSQNLQQCMKGQVFAEAPKLLVIAREGKDWAFTRTLNYSGAYGYGINNTNWQGKKPESRGIIFSDRQLYQPGEKVQLTGAAYYLQNGNIKQDTNTRYAITLQSPDGQKTDLGTKITNNFGTFSLELPLKNSQALGYYSIRAKAENGTEITGQFRIAEFKPPNFKVNLNLDKKFATIGDKIEVKSNSNYLFGLPVEAGKATYYVTRQKTEFKPQNWDNFYFGRQWFWPDESPSVPSDVLQQTEVLNAEGKGSQTVTVAKDLPYPMQYRVDVEVGDVSNLSVSDSQTFTALPSNLLIGLKSDFVADAGKSFPVEVIVSDATGKITPGERVKIELQQMKYSSVTRVLEGSRTPKNQVEYKTVMQTEIKSGDNPVSVALIAPESGSYRIRANFVNAKDEITATDVQIWATGDNLVRWGRRGDQDEHLEVKLDKTTYKLGETATALIQSPYPEAELYFAVIRNKILYQTITKVKGGAPQIQFKITPDMLPNAAIEAVLIRQGLPLDKVEPESVENLMQVGFAPFKINLEDKYLQLKITPNQTELQPGATANIQLELKDKQGQTIRGQLTVMVVNEAVLQLSGYRPPDLVKTVYAEQSISTRFSDNRSEVVLQPISSPLQKGWGYGGGFSAGAANTRIRKDFQALAYYNPGVITDSNGKAEITFKLPDDLTTWRVMAVASSDDMRFATADASFIATKSLMANPILPQFARIGDNFAGGISVINNTHQTGNLEINSAVKGAVKLANNQGYLQTPAESGIRAYRFPMVATNAGQSQISFTAQINGINDAFEVPLQVKLLEVMEQVVETGITNNQVKIPLNVDKKVMPDVGGLQVSIASTLIPEITAPAQQVLDEEQLPFLEPAASALIIAANLQNLSQKYGQNFAKFNPPQAAAKAIEKIEKLQLPDGGFAYTPGQKNSDPFVSPYTAEALAKASKAFPNAVDFQMISRVNSYLKKIIANPGIYDFCKQNLCKNQIRLDALMALAEMGEKRNDFLADIYKQRDDFDVVNQLKLARYLSLFPEWQQESKTLFNQLQKIMYQTGRSAVVNLPKGWGWMNSPTTTQTEALRLAIAQNMQPETIDRLLQGLLNLRRNGTWQSTYNNAEALTALVEYSKLEPTPPNFTATVKLAGKKLDSIRFNSYRNPSLSINVAMDNLPRNRHDLIIQKSGQGTLHYLVDYRYVLQGNQPGKYNGLRVTREISPVNQEKVLQKIGMQTPPVLNIKAGQVFDIGLEIITDRPVERVVITDSLPAGFEAIDNSLQTATKALEAKQDDFGFKTIYRDRVVAYSDRLETGVYQLHYLVRSVTPGNFNWPGAEVHLQYAPEEFGRSADSNLIIKE